MNRIALIGFSGCGKSTTGKKLSLKLGLKFVDTDSVFELKYNSSISHFFENYGETAFRKCELMLLQELLQQDNILLSTGGGTPCSNEAIELLISQSIVVYIKMSPRSLANRLIHAKKRRPLTVNKNEQELLNYIESTMATRSPYYEKADIIVKGEDININETAEIIKNYSQSFSYQ